MIIHNPTTTDVPEYPIEDPKNGEVNLWSLAAGQTLDFPEHVGKYLLEVYGFLQRVMTQEQVDIEAEEARRKETGQTFSQVKIVKSPEKGFTNEMVQPPAPTPEQLQPHPVTPTPIDQQMVGAVEGDEADKVPVVPQAVPTTSVKPDVNAPEVPTVKKNIICPTCGVPFQNEAAMKTHYAHKHLVLPPAK
jgi:hypothetical protein